MKINDILNLFLQQEYTVSEIEMNGVDYLVMNMFEANGQLSISCPNSTALIFEFRYLHNKNGQGTMHFPKLSVDIENFKDVKPFLNQLFEQFEFRNTSIFHNNLEERDKVFKLLKSVLSGETLPDQYSLQLSKLKDGTILILHLRDNLNKKAFNIDFRRIDSDYLPGGITSLISALKIHMETFDLNDENSSPSLLGNFVIPGYELHKYPLLQKYNKIEKVHTNVHDWAKELANFPNLERGQINVGLETLILHDELLENKPNKRKTPKL